MDEHSCRTDNVHGRIGLTRIEEDLAHKPVFNRLHHVYQNSSAFLIWRSVRTQLALADCAPNKGVLK